MTGYDVKSACADDFISHEEIIETLEYADAHKGDAALVDEILKKAEPVHSGAGLKCAGLSHRDASVLLASEVPGVMDRIYELAARIKKEFYGNRIVLFAPLYLSNYCIK